MWHMVVCAFQLWGHVLSALISAIVNKCMYAYVIMQIVIADYYGFP